VTDGGES